MKGHSKWSSHYRGNIALWHKCVRSLVPQPGGIMSKIINQMKPLDYTDVPSTSWEFWLLGCELNGRHFDNDLKTRFLKLVCKTLSLYSCIIQLLENRLWDNWFAWKVRFFLRFVIEFGIAINFRPVHLHICKFLRIWRCPILIVFVTIDMLGLYDLPTQWVSDEFLPRTIRVGSPNVASPSSIFMGITDSNSKALIPQRQRSLNQIFNCAIDIRKLRRVNVVDVACKLNCAIFLESDICW